LHWGGAIVILGMIAVLGAAYLILGGCESRRGAPARNYPLKAFERFSTGSPRCPLSFSGLTGLNITFGKILLCRSSARRLLSVSQVAK